MITKFKINFLLSHHYFNTPKEFCHFGRDIWCSEKNDTVQHYLSKKQRGLSHWMQVQSEKEKFHLLFGASHFMCLITWKKLIDYNHFPQNVPPSIYSGPYCSWSCIIMRIYYPLWLVQATECLENGTLTIVGELTIKNVFISFLSF